MNSNDCQPPRASAACDARLKQIEEEDKNKPQLVCQYQQKIFEYLRQIEVGPLFC